MLKGKKQKHNRETQAGASSVSNATYEMLNLLPTLHERLNDNHKKYNTTYTAN